MRKAQRFIFDRYFWDATSRTIELTYGIDDDLSFTERIMLPADIAIDPAIDSLELDRALFTLHLAAGTSYYKTYLPPVIEVKSGKLNEQQAHFWTTVYERGLGEFFFKNMIDFRDRIRFPATSTSDPVPLPPPADRPRKVLAPLGGGKDSLVTIELLKAGKIDLTLLRVGGHPLIEESARIAERPLLTVTRELSPLLFELNKQDAYNGHIPITAFISALSVVIAILTGHTHVVFSNERSASEGNTVLFGMEVNHQWSKSLEFERMFQRYLSNFVTRNVGYFSLLRPLSELSIAKLMSGYPQYFQHFTSCNANWKILEKKEEKRWCGHCPKCAFSFLLFAAFLDREALVNIFGGNFFEDETLVPLYSELLGRTGIKPFECVGTPDEATVAFLLAHTLGGYDETPAMQLFLEKPMTVSEMNPIMHAVLEPSDEHAVPDEFLQLLPADKA